MASMPTVLVCAFPSTVAVMASMGLRESVVSILVGLEEFNCLLYVNDDLAALLHDSGLEEGVLVALRGEVGAVEQGLDALESVDVPLAVSGGGPGGCRAVVDVELQEEFFEVADCDGGQGCCVFDNHFFDD